MEIEELQEEIEILKKRINNLERKENIRKAHSYFKMIIKIIIIALIVFGIWYGYNYVVNEIPNIVDDKIKSIIPTF